VKIYIGEQYVEDGMDSETTTPSKANETTLMRECDSIAKLLSVPSDDESQLDLHRYDSLNKSERLMRLFLDLYLPKNVFPEIIAEDLAYLVAYNLLAHDEREKLLNDWYVLRGLDPLRETEAFMRFPDGTIYRSIHDLLCANSITFGEFLSILLQRTKRIAKYKKEPLTCYEVTRLIDNAYMSWKTTLSAEDIKVVKCVQKIPLIKKKEISNILKLNENTVSGIIKRLKTANNFSVQGRPRESALGMQSVIFKTGERLSIDFPYLLSVQELRAGNVIYDYAFRLPKHTDTISPLEDVVTVMEDNINNFSLLKFMGCKHSLSFRYYNPIKTCWMIDWVAWSLLLKDKLNSGKSDKKTHSSKIDNKEFNPHFFDVKDLHILNCFHNDMRVPMTKLGKQLDMTSQGIKNRIIRLLDEGFVDTATILHQIGLEEQIILEYNGDEDYTQTLKSAIYELPESFTYLMTPLRPKTPNQILVAWLRLPAGSLMNLTKTLTRILGNKGNIWIAHRFQFRASTRPLPIEMFDQKSNRWRWDEEVLKNLIIS